MHHLRSLIFWLVPLVLLAGCQAYEAPPRAEAGTLDLRGYAWSERDYVPLDGAWEFIWGGFIAPGNIDTERRDTLLEVPGVWNSLEIGGEPLPGEGYATYHLTVRLDSSHLAQPLTLTTKAVRMAFSLYLNGEEVIRRGEVQLGQFMARVQPARYTFTPQQTRLDLVMHVANRGFSHGGIVNSLRLGPAPAMRTLYENSLSTDLFLAGCLSIVSVYHLILFFTFRRQRSTLYFGALCFIFVVRTLTTGEYYLLDLWPGLPNALMMRLEFSTVYLGPWVVVLFLREIFPEEVPRWLVQVSHGFAAVLFAALLIPSGLVYSTILPLSHLHILLGGGYLVVYSLPKALIRRRPSAPLFLSAMVVLFLSVINDILYVQFLVSTGFILPYGMLYFIFVQAMALAIRYGRTFSQLQVLRGQLERKVGTRKQQLEQKNEELEGQHADLEQQSQQLTTSLAYAETLQRTSIERHALLLQMFPQAFVLFSPRERIGGDFAWLTRVGHQKFVAVGDCTGQGVHGAFLSAMGQTLLDQIVQQEQVTDPARILNRLDAELSALYERWQEQGLGDTLDLGVLVIDEVDREIRYCGARLDMVRLRELKMAHFRAQRNTLGGMRPATPKTFTTITAPYETGDRYYLYSDGFAAQFGGPKDEKYLPSRFRTLLLQTAAGTLEAQKHRIQSTLERWKGAHPQTDDVLVLGIAL